MTNTTYVVTPVYNGEKYLRETMDSVQAQTWPNLIHLVVDNASTDATPKILREYSDAQVPVRVIRNDNLLPQIDNWNKAVALIPEDAEWFRLLCADDTIAPDYIEKCVTAGRGDKDIGIVTCDVNSGDSVQNSVWPDDIGILDGREALRRFLTLRGNLLAPHLLYRPDVLSDDAPFFDETASAFDTDAVLRSLCNCKLGIVHETLAVRRLHDDTVTAREVLPKRLHLFQWYEFLHRYGHEVFPFEENTALRRRYRRHYLWRLLRAAFVSRNVDVWEIHSRHLNEIGEKPGIADVFSVLMDRFLIFFRLRKGWGDYPW
ncbi:MAG: glycosyltransferase family 2 protein [Pseudomonadota bacterium]